MAYPASPAVNHEVDPVSRIEGHLGIGITATTSGGAAETVLEANAHGNLWRGFENFLIGREPNDAITFVQRICGVCPVPHGMTSTYAVDTVLGYSAGHITFAQGTGTGAAADNYGVPKKAVVIRNLVLGSEFLMSSITHFYHLVAPSWVQGPQIPPWTPYFDSAQYSDALKSSAAIPTRGADGTYSADVWSTVIRSYVRALRIRRLTFEAGALFAGRMPMTSCYVAGGVTFDGTENIGASGNNKIGKFRQIMTEVGLFIIQEYVPVVLALSILYPEYDNTGNTGLRKDLGGTLAGKGWGAGVGRFLAWGAFPQTDAAGTLGAYGGFYDASAASGWMAQNKLDIYNTFLGTGANSVPSGLTEDIAWSRYGVASGDVTAYGSASGTVAYPGDVSRTKPVRANGYSYMKAPRWQGMSAEVGPYARLVVAQLYPVDGTTAFLNASGNALQQFYATYATTAAGTAGGTGLDPKMVYPDIAVALVRAGLASLVTSTNNGDASITVTKTGGGGVDINTLSVDTINAAYSFSGGSGSALNKAYITGAVTNAIVAMKGGLSLMDRLRARAFESAIMIQNLIGAYNKNVGSWTIGSQNINLASSGSGTTAKMAQYSGTFTGGWINDASLLSTSAGSTWRNDVAFPTGVSAGWGANEAPRGALMHQCTIDKGKITKYQCIVPTTWNGSPKDSQWNASASDTVKKMHRGPIEQSCIGVPFQNGNTTYGTGQPTGYGNNAGMASGTWTAKAGGVEVVRCAQSFDPCIACAVH